MDSNQIKKFMDFILMAIMDLSIQGVSLTFKKNKSLLCILSCRLKLTHLMWYSRDTIHVLLQKYSKTYVGFVKVGINSNLNL